jgi:hypothetical protein
MREPIRNVGSSIRDEEPLLADDMLIRDEEPLATPTWAWFVLAAAVSRS